MPKKLLVIFGVVIVIFTLIVLYLFQGDVNGISRKSFVSSEWKETYTIEDKNPNGNFLFNELLEFQTKKTSTIIDYDIDSTILPKYSTSYFFIGDEFQLKTEEFDSIMNRVKNGSNLFIAYNTISENVHEYFFKNKNFEWEYSDYIDVYAQKKNFRFYSVFQSDTIASEWNFFPKSNEKTSDFDDVSSESSVQNLSNFLNFKHGKGHVYLHSNPRLFANYQLLSKAGFEYSQFVVEKIPAKHEIKWLEIARLTIEEREGDSGEKDTSYLKFIFDNKALTIALLIAVLGILLFLIFRTKRSEPLIPYIPKSFNHSLIFADTIKEIYFKQQTPYNILLVMRKNFQLAVNKQFFVDISKENNEHELHVLQEKSSISKQKLAELVSKLNTSEESSVNFQYLQEVSKLQQEFYLESGIIKSKVKKKIDSKAKIVNRKILLALSLIFLGIALILASFYFLHKSKGSVILFWPLGILCLSLGIRLLSTPVLKLEGEMITFYFVFLAKKRFNVKEITKVEQNSSSTTFSIEKSGGEFHKITVNHSEISAYDVNRFQQIVLNVK
ncbi:MAG: hypothetical protein V4622_12585 [Bacteroidota bacterium]